MPRREHEEQKVQGRSIFSSSRNLVWVSKTDFGKI